MKEREEKIKDAIEAIVGVRPETERAIPEEIEYQRRTYKINDVLLISSSYDFFLVEESGRLEDIFEDIYHKVGIESIPQIRHIEDVDKSLDIVEESNPDLVIIFNELRDTDVNELSKDIKKKSENLPLVFLSNNTPIIDQIKEKNEGEIEKIFTWNGDGRILLSIIHYIEDLVNLKNEEITEKEERAILLIEDSVEFYSTYIHLIYEEIWTHLTSIIDDSLTREQKILRYKRRPFVIHSDNFGGGKQYYKGFEDNLLAIITDNHDDSSEPVDKTAGIKFAKEVKKSKEDIPVLVQSSRIEYSDQLDENDIEFIEKQSPELTNYIRKFVRKSLGSSELVFKDKKDREVVKIKSLEKFREKIWSIESELIIYNFKNGNIVNWLKSLGEYELADKVNSLELKEKEGKKLKKSLINIFEEHEYSIEESTITQFRRDDYNPHNKIIRIGKGALGGKARGLAFMGRLLSEYITPDMFKDFRITVPRSIVLSTDVFESFMEENELLDSYLINLSDERIASKFMNASLPPTVIGDIRSFIRETRNPLIVRSSGVLEDSLTEPFAGVYASMLLPNESWETDLRFQEVCNAIKYVYSSTFFEKARTYIRSTPKKIGDEKMGVILQEVVGKKHDKYFYPDISGVAKSYNHYPPEGCESEDGIVYLTLGLGKSVVEGGKSYCFCPEHPKTPMYGTPKDYIEHSQTKFYSLNLESVYRIVNKDEETSLEELDIKIAEDHGVLEKLASTYSYQNDKLYPGINYEGARIIDFAPIIRYKSVPLVKALRLLLKISEIALGYPVEIEFTVNLNEKKPEPAELTVLQIRSMISKEMYVEVDIGDYDPKNLLCYSENALGNGIIDGIKDIVFVNPNNFNMGKSPETADKIKKINRKMMSEDRSYILIGPGRWGSNDHWLGIPVQWSDIAGAKVIIETPVEGRRIEPSQGSHFFHDMISSQSGYLMTEKGEGNVDWDWLESLELIEEKDSVKHVRVKHPLQIKIDGKKGKGIVMKKVNKDEGENRDVHNQ